MNMLLEFLPSSADLLVGSYSTGLPEMHALTGAGRISIAELRKVLQRLGRSELSDDEIGAIMRQSDKDRDGYITLDEFTATPTVGPAPRASPPPQVQRVVDMGTLPDGWEQMTYLQKEEALSNSYKADRRSGRGSTAYLARLKSALLYELSRSGDLPDVQLRGVGMHQEQKKKRKASKAQQKKKRKTSKDLIAFLDDEILRLLEGERECLKKLGQCMPDQRHRHPVWDDGEEGMKNFRLRPFGAQRSTHISKPESYTVIPTGVVRRKVT